MGLLVQQCIVVIVPTIACIRSLGRLLLASCRFFALKKSSLRRPIVVFVAFDPGLTSLPSSHSCIYVLSLSCLVSRLPTFVPAHSIQTRTHTTQGLSSCSSSSGLDLGPHSELPCRAACLSCLPCLVSRCHPLTTTHNHTVTGTQGTIDITTTSNHGGKFFLACHSQSSLTRLVPPSLTDPLPPTTPHDHRNSVFPRCLARARRRTRRTRHRISMAKRMMRPSSTSWYVCVACGLGGRKCMAVCQSTPVCLAGKR